MSLGDHLKFLRAVSHGVTPNEIGDIIGLNENTINLVEIKHRREGSDETLAKLAEYFAVPVAELAWHRERFRKKLTAFLAERIVDQQPLRVTLRTGEELTGRVTSYDLKVILLETSGQAENEIVVVQRSSIDDWDLLEYAPGVPQPANNSGAGAYKPEGDLVLDEQDVDNESTE